jgi:hypothetical protein
LNGLWVYLWAAIDVESRELAVYASTSAPLFERIHPSPQRLWMPA